MGKRREGREAAIQFLFSNDLNTEQELAKLLENFWELRPASVGVREFSAKLIEGVLGKRAEVDERIKRHAVNYELHRIAAVDRNILRVAIYEMLFSQEVPPIVSINEAIEIAKRFGSEDSGRFVNGILDRVRHEIPRDARRAAAESDEGSAPAPVA